MANITLPFSIPNLNLTNYSIGKIGGWESIEAYRKFNTYLYDTHAFPFLEVKDRFESIATACNKTGYRAYTLFSGINNRLSDEAVHWFKEDFGVCEAEPEAGGYNPWKAVAIILISLIGMVGLAICVNTWSRRPTESGTIATDAQEMEPQQETPTVATDNRYQLLSSQSQGSEQDSRTQSIAVACEEPSSPFTASLDRIRDKRYSAT